MQGLRARNRASMEQGERSAAPRLRRDRKAENAAAAAPTGADIDQAAPVTRTLHVVPQSGLAPRRSSFRTSVALRRDRRAAAVVTLDEQRERTATDEEVRIVADAERRRGSAASWSSASSLTSDRAATPRLVDATAAEAQRDFAARREERERREVAMLAERIQAFADRLAREAS